MKDLEQRHTLSNIQHHAAIRIKNESAASHHRNIKEPGYECKCVVSAEVTLEIGTIHVGGFEGKTTHPWRRSNFAE